MKSMPFFVRCPLSFFVLISCLQPYFIKVNACTFLLLNNLQDLYNVPCIHFEQTINLCFNVHTSVYASISTYMNLKQSDVINTPFHCRSDLPLYHCYRWTFSPSMFSSTNELRQKQLRHSRPTNHKKVRIKPYVALHILFTLKALIVSFFIL